MTEVRIIKTTDLIPGMIVSGDIANELGVVVLYNEFVLDENSINKLETQGISSVRILFTTEESDPHDNLSETPYDIPAVPEKKSPSAVERQIEIEKNFNNGVNQLKNVIYGISMGKTVELHHVHEITKMISGNFGTISDAVVCLNKVREIDDYTYAHSMNVATLASLLGGWLNLPPQQIKQLLYCGLLHDIGKSKISHDILTKPGKLSPKELEEIRKHPVYGYKSLEKSTTISAEIAKGVLLHHEREDGSGYPFGLTSDKIPLFAKIIGIVDTFDAMTANRVYADRFTPFEVMDLFKSEYLTKCDPGIMMVFMQNISAYYIGHRVRLSNGASAEIIYINPLFLSKPIVKVGNGRIFDLSTNTDLKIEEML